MTSSEPELRLWGLLRRSVIGLLRQPRLMLATALLALATWLPPIMRPSVSHSFLIVFDITQSMGVTDMTLNGQAVSRLDFAKETLRQTLRQMPCGSRVGWGAFADYRTMPLLQPLEVCAHFDALQSSLNGIDARMRWANASHVAKGLYWSLRSALAIDPTTVTIFITDGHEAPPVAIGDSGSLLMDKPMVGLVVGVGQEQPSPIPRTDEDGRVLAFWKADEVVQRQDVPSGSSHEELSGLAQGHLRALAERHSLSYLRMTDQATLLSAMRGMGHGEERLLPTDQRWMPAGVALLLLLWPYAHALAMALATSSLRKLKPRAAARVRQVGSPP
jgi:mxaL protein